MKRICKCGGNRFTVFKGFYICHNCGLEHTAATLWPKQYPIAEEKINAEENILRLGTEGTGKAPEVDRRQGNGQ